MFGDVMTLPMALSATCVTSTSVNRTNASSVNMTLMIEVNCEKINLNFKLISSHK
jgi:hypothetical protein